MKKQVLLFYFILSFLSISAEKKSSYITLTTEHGLTSNTINCIYQDSKGFIWIGTADGLNRFDGNDVLSFDNFKNKSIINIVEPDSSSLYILSERDLYKFDRKTRKNTPIKIEGNKEKMLESFSLDRYGNLYIIGKEGFFLLTKGSYEAVKVNPINTSDSFHFTDIYIDKNDICWLATSEGFIKYDLLSKKINIYKNDIDNNLLCITSLNEYIYIGTANSNIICFNTQTNKFSHIGSLDTPAIQTIASNDNKLYIGTNGNGLKIIDLTNNKASTLIDNKSNPNNSANMNAIYSILVNDSSFWVGTFSGGITYTPYLRQTFNTLPNNDIEFSVPSLNIRSFIVDNKGYGIYGTRNGLIYNSDGKVQYYTTENTPELKSNIILCIYPYNDEDYFVGTYSGGLYLLNKKSKKLRVFREELIFSENSFYSIIQGSKESNIVWFGTLSGLIKYNLEDNSFQIFNTSNSDIVSNDIYHLLTDSSGRIWIATRDGICYIDRDKITRLTEPKFPSIGIVRYVYEDSKQNIWLGCENQGAFAFSHDLSSFRHYTTQNILPGNYVSSIIEDDLGKIWMTTTKGILSYENDSRYIIHSLSEGLPSYSFNDGAVQKTKDGTIWWGNEKGLVFLNPKTTQETVSSKINITKVIIDGFSEGAKLNTLRFAPEYLSTIRVPASEKNLSFRFTDLVYDFPSTIVYEYKLEGTGDTWQKTLSGKDILIPKIPSGKHILKIRKAGSNDEVKEILIVKDRSYTVVYVILLFAILSTLLIILYKRIISRSRKSAKAAIDKEKADKVKYQNLKLEKDELAEIKHAIINFMEKERPYLNPNFKLDDMATATNYSKIKISQVLNLHLNTNFSNFVSTYRIEAFKEKAKEGFLQQYTLSALAKECGFSSRSSFFQTMKKLTGQTPTEFLREAGITIEKL